MGSGLRIQEGRVVGSQRACGSEVAWRPWIGEVASVRSEISTQVVLSIPFHFMSLQFSCKSNLSQLWEKESILSPSMLGKKVKKETLVSTKETR